MDFGYHFLFIVLLTITKATRADIFFNDKEDNQINSHNIKKIRPSFPRDSFELAFPFFNELFPLSGLDAKSKEIFNKNKEDKDLLQDFSDTPETPQLSKAEKLKKKNGKDKLIMSFTELFIPFQNHKSQFEFNNVKKSDIFDDIFNSFPFADMDGGFFEKHDKQSVLKRHKVPKRKYDKNLISSTNSTNSKVILKNDGKDEIPKHSLLNRFETEFFKAPNVITLFSKDNNSDEMCCSHEECHKGDQCTPDKCKLNLNINEDSNLNNENNLNKKSILLDKTCLIYAIPGLIGIGALIFGIEVLRRHNELVKQTPFLSQYNQVQTC